MIKKSATSNRIRVLTESIPGARSLSLGVQVGVGSLDDPVDASGMAHFTEHSLFQGTTGRSAQDISGLIDQAGGHMGAFTGRDYTCFYANIMQDYAPFAIDLIGDILLNSTFPEEALAREREAVVNEIKMGADDPFSRLNDVVREKIWPNHAHGRPVSGDIESVSQFSREDVIYFAGQNYTPDRLTIAAAGAVDHDNFVEQVQDAFWRMLGVATPESNEPPPVYRPAIHIETTGVSQAYFAVAIPTLQFDAPQRFDLHALTTILGGGLSSRLYRSLREEQGLAYYIQSSYQAYRDVGLLWIEGVTNPESLMDALESVNRELHNLATESIDPEELWKTQMQLRGQHQLAADSAHTRMTRLMTQEFFFGQNEEENVIEGINSVTAATVQEVAQSLLETTASCAVIGPESLDTSKQRICDLFQNSDNLITA